MKCKVSSQDKKLYTEIEVQSLIFSSLVKHYNEVEKQTELDHDELLKENYKLKQRIADLENNQMNVVVTDTDYIRLREQCQKLLEDKKKLLNQIADMNKRK